MSKQPPSNGTTRTTHHSARADRKLVGFALAAVALAAAGLAGAWMTWASSPAALGGGEFAADPVLGALAAPPVARFADGSAANPFAASGHTEGNTVCEAGADPTGGAYDVCAFVAADRSTSSVQYGLPFGICGNRKYVVSSSALHTEAPATATYKGAATATASAAQAKGTAQSYSYADCWVGDLYFIRETTSSQGQSRATTVPLRLVTPAGPLGVKVEQVNSTSRDTWSSYYLLRGSAWADSTSTDETTTSRSTLVAVTAPGLPGAAGASRIAIGTTNTTMQGTGTSCHAGSCATLPLAGRDRATGAWVDAAGHAAFAGQSDTGAGCETTARSDGTNVLPAAARACPVEAATLLPFVEVPDFPKPPGV